MPVGDTVLGLSARATHSHVENVLDLTTGARLLRLKGVNPNASTHYVYCLAVLAASSFKSFIANWTFILGGAVQHQAPFNAAGINTLINNGESIYRPAGGIGGITRFGIAPVVNTANSHTNTISSDGYDKLAWCRYGFNLISATAALTGATPVLPYRWHIKCDEIQLVVSSTDLDMSVIQSIGVVVMSE